MSPVTRRAFLRDAAILSAGVVTHGRAEGEAPKAIAPLQQEPAAAVPPGSVPLRWVGDKVPAVATGVSWGVPWPQGAVKRDASFSANAGGTALPLQTWPLAFWPDGSLKWSGFATVLPANATVPVVLSKSAGTATGSLKVTKDPQSVVVDTGVATLTLPLTGPEFLRSISAGGKQIGGAARLICILQDGPETEPEDAPRRERYTSSIQHVTVEQSGPVRAVVKVEGVHRGLTSHREWLPFTLRLYFFTGQATVRLVHSITFDGDQERDFVRGLGVQFDVPMRDEPRNRTVRFAGAEGGIWSEPLQPGGGSVEQETGKPFAGSPIFGKNAMWDDFKLSQPNPHGFTVVKRTNPKSTWLFSAAGTRSEGLVFVGDLGGGLALSVKDFWQSYPAGLEVQGASNASAKLTTWLWSPDGPPMDMRHYDTHAHGLDASYEDVQPGLSTAHGVARTSELTLYACDHWPTRAETAAMAEEGTRRPLLGCTPEYIHSTGVLGVWSVADRSTAFRKSIEDGLDSVLAFYQRQVDDRSWYGFWQYGDFLHSYSAPRHVWHYDWGGHAWDNTELGAPLWLWYSYLRSGRADLFRLAEAHTRNTSETDVYHLGPMQGLGSRHNVIKWGDGAKEARISQSAHWRTFYYLTTDERTGDLMRMVTEAAAESITRYDPMREASPPTPGEPAIRIRLAPDWFALAGNWMTEWERTGDARWRDHILAGVDSILAMQFELETGKPVPNPKAQAAIVGYDAKTGKLTPIPDQKTGQFAPMNYNLATIQGGGEVMFELVPLLGRKDFETAWLRMCRIGDAPADVYLKDKATNNEGADASYVVPGQSGPRLAAYAYAKTKNLAFADKAIAMLLSSGASITAPHIVPAPESLKPVEEDATISTNEAAQTGLSAIEVLELCQDHLPTGPAVRTPRPRRPPPRQAR